MNRILKLKVNSFRRRLAKYAICKTIHHKNKQALCILQKGTITKLWTLTSWVQATTETQRIILLYGWPFVSKGLSSVKQVSKIKNDLLKKKKTNF